LIWTAHTKDFSRSVIDNGLAEMRKKMTKKYNVEF